MLMRHALHKFDAKVNFPCLILSIDSNLPFLELRLGEVHTTFFFKLSIPKNIRVTVSLSSKFYIYIYIFILFFRFRKSSSFDIMATLLRCEDLTRDVSALIRSSSSCSCRRASSLIAWYCMYETMIFMQDFIGKFHMGVSKNNGTVPILIGFSILNHPFWGTTIFGNTHMPYDVHTVLAHLILQAAKLFTWRRSSAVRLDSSMLSRRAASVSKAWELQV